MANQKVNYLGLIVLFFSVHSYGMDEKQITLEEKVKRVFVKKFLKQEDIFKNIRQEADLRFKNAPTTLKYYREVTNFCINEDAHGEIDQNVIKNIFSTQVLSCITMIQPEIVDNLKERYYKELRQPLQQILDFEDKQQQLHYQYTESNRHFETQIRNYLDSDPKIPLTLHDEIINGFTTTTLLSFYHHAKDIANRLNTPIDQHTMINIFTNVVISFTANGPLTGEHLKKRQFVVLFAVPIKTVLNREEENMTLHKAAIDNPHSEPSTHKSWFRQHPVFTTVGFVIAFIALLHYLDKLPNNMAQWLTNYMPK